MYKNILLPIADSSLAESVFPLTNKLLKQRDSKVSCLHILPDSVAREWEDAGVRIENTCEWLKALSMDLDNATIETMVRIGEAQAEIRKTALTSASDLIIMPTHARTGLKRFRLGSVAEDVLHSVEIPVLLVHLDDRQHESIERIMMPIQDEMSLDVLPDCINMARLFNAEVILLHVEFGTGENNPTVSDKAKCHLDKAKQALDAAGVINRAVTSDSADIARATDAAIQEFDVQMITMSTHGYSDIIRGIRGSVADTIARTVRIPVLVKAAPPGRDRFEELHFESG